jgi:predicted transcriptional regulator
LILSQWNKSEFSTYQKNLRRGRNIETPPTRIQKTANIQVENNQDYQLVLTETETGIIIEIENKKVLRFLVNRLLMLK